MTFEEAENQFWKLAATLLKEPGTEEGRIMNSRCLRVNGDFCAMVARSGELVVKLPRTRVAESIEQGSGSPFAPAGRVFKEWLAVTDDDLKTWQSYMMEAHKFVSG